VTPLAAFFAGIGAGTLATIVLGHLLERTYWSGYSDSVLTTYMKWGTKWGA
jgi:hypothetical protein